jgi:hypothetical protein
MLWRVCEQSCSRDAYVQCPVVEDGLDLDDHVEIFFGRNSHRMNRNLQESVSERSLRCTVDWFLLQFSVHKRERERESLLHGTTSLPYVHRSLYTVQTLHQAISRMC